MREGKRLRREEEGNESMKRVEEEGGGEWIQQEWRMILLMLLMRRWNCVENESTFDDPAIIFIIMVHSSSLYCFSLNHTVSLPLPYLSLLLSIHGLPQMSCR